MKIKVIRKTKGGPGSGNWGHAGRPGLHGGSAPGGGKVIVRSSGDMSSLKKGAIVTVDGEFYHFTNHTNLQSIMETGLRPSGNALLGNAVYLTPEKVYDSAHGSTRLAVHVKANNVLNVGNYSDYGKWLSDRGFVTGDPAEAFKSLGYQGALITREDGRKILAIFDPALVQVLGER